VYSDACLVKWLFWAVFIFGLFAAAMSFQRVNWDMVSMFVIALICAVILNSNFFPAFLYKIGNGIADLRFYDKDDYLSSCISGHILRTVSRSRIEMPFYWPHKMGTYHIGGSCLVAYGQLLFKNCNVVSHCYASWVLVTLCLTYLMFRASMISGFIATPAIIATVGSILGQGFILAVDIGSPCCWGSFFLAVAFLNLAEEKIGWGLFFLISSCCFKIALPAVVACIVILFILPKLKEIPASAIFACLFPVFVFTFLFLLSKHEIKLEELRVVLRTHWFYPADMVSSSFFVDGYKRFFEILFNWFKSPHLDIFIMVFQALFPGFLVLLVYITLKPPHSARMAAMTALIPFFCVVPSFLFETVCDPFGRPYTLDPWGTCIIMAVPVLCLGLGLLISGSNVRWLALACLIPFLRPEPNHENWIMLKINESRTYKDGALVDDDYIYAGFAGKRIINGAMGRKFAVK
jgi:hypothetical protein